MGTYATLVNPAVAGKPALPARRRKEDAPHFFKPIEPSSKDELPRGPTSPSC